MGRIAWIGTGVAVAVLAVAVAVVSWPGRSSTPVPTGQMANFELSEARERAPEISFSDAEGNRLTLADFDGRVVLLNLWATWCAPCVHEMPTLDRLQARLGGDRFEVVALSIDRGGADDVLPFFAAHGLDHLNVYLDTAGAAPSAFDVIGLPTTVLIDADGRLVGQYTGAADWDGADAVTLMEQTIAGG